VSGTPRVALVGGGLGGLTAAITLARNGFDAHVFEQADRLREVGAGIGLSPNALNVLRALGVEDDVKRLGSLPDAIIGCDWTSGQQLFRVQLKGAVESRFGAANVQIHRGDLLHVLAGKIPPSQIHLNSRCVAVSCSDNGATLSFSSGRREQFDLVVGCDGIRSSVRTATHGRESPRFTGNMCWRALVDAGQLPPALIPSSVTNWIGSGGHVVTYCVRGGALVNVVAVRETPDWIEESWSIPARTGDLVAAFPTVHRDLRTLLERAGDCFKWGLYDRDPLPRWTTHRATLLGDAAHPMLPFLGQGAAMAMEDAYVLARELVRTPDDVEAGMRAYEAERRPRTSRVQIAAREQARFLHVASSRETRLVEGRDAVLGSDLLSNYEIDWLYQYDPTRGRDPIP
jgi:salicylate hydroxylase